MRAIEALENRFGWTVTYEEAPLLYRGDAVDVTAYRKVQDRTKPPLLAPRGGPFTFVTSYSAGQSPMELLEALLQQYHATGYPGVFRVLRTGDVFHVVLTMRKNAKGVLEAQQPLLDVPVTIADTERSAGGTIEAVLAEIRRTTGASVYPGTTPLNLLGETRVQLGATNESARGVLVKVLETTSRVTAPPLKLSWKLMCSLSPSECFLNVDVVGK
jgi:hypothetical protein